MTRTASPSCECQACKDTGLVFPPRGLKLSQWDGSLSSLPPFGALRDMPLPCALCPAGEIERRVAAIVGTKPGLAIEFEIYQFRKAKG